MITINNERFGANNPYIVAELGINHNGDISLAKESIAAASESGVDSIKFQNYKTDDFIKDKTLTIEYTNNKKEITETQYDLFKRCELLDDQLFELKNECEKFNINFHSTPTSIEGVNLLKNMGCEIVKNGSDFLNNTKLITYMAESGMLVVLSTGMANASDVETGINSLNNLKKNKYVVLHCTSSYPTPIDEINLARMKSIEMAFDCNIGFSDHSETSTASIAATVMGACWIEKHYTLDKKLSGPDHQFSIDPFELKEFVKNIREACKSIGNSTIQSTQSEEYGREKYRLSCVANKSLKKGCIVKNDDIYFSRPGNGIPPNEAEKLIIGSKLIKSIKNGQSFRVSDFIEK